MCNQPVQHGSTVNLGFVKWIKHVQTQPITVKPIQACTWLGNDYSPPPPPTPTQLPQITHRLSMDQLHTAGSTIYQIEHFVVEVFPSWTPLGSPIMCHRTLTDIFHRVRGLRVWPFLLTHHKWVATCHLLRRMGQTTSYANTAKWVEKTIMHHKVRSHLISHLFISTHNHTHVLFLIFLSTFL